jgi:hypothetical protein
MRTALGTSPVRSRFIDMMLQVDIQSIFLALSVARSPEGAISYPEAKSA